MSYTALDASKFVGKSVGDGHGDAFAQAAAAMPDPVVWKQGSPVRGAALAPGTAIATFGKNGRYLRGRHRRSHAAIYLGQTAAGIRVLDQWLHLGQNPDGSAAPQPVAVHERTIAFHPHSDPVDDAGNYFVVE